VLTFSDKDKPIFQESADTCEAMEKNNFLFVVVQVKYRE